MECVLMGAATEQKFQGMVVFVESNEKMLVEIPKKGAKYYQLVVVSQTPPWTPPPLTDYGSHLKLQLDSHGRILYATVLPTDERLYQNVSYDGNNVVKWSTWLYNASGTVVED